MPVLAIFGVEFVGLIVALMIILLLLAGSHIFRVISGVLSHLPVVGSFIASTIGGWLADTMQHYAALVEAQAVSFSHLFYSTAVGLWHLINQVVTNIADVKQWAMDAYSTAENAYTQATAFSVGYINGWVRTLEGEITNAALGAEAGLANLANEALSTATAAEALAHALADEVSSEAVRLFGQAEAAAAAGTAEAEALAQALADSVQSEAVRLFGTAEGDITIIQGQVQALPGEIAQTIPGIIDGIVPGIIAGAIPGILAQVIPRVATLEAQADECLEPLCDTVTPNAGRLGNLGNLFKNLEDLGIEALFIALAAEAAHDPGAVARDVSAVVDDVGGGLLAGFRDLVGV